MLRYGGCTRSSPNGGKNLASGGIEKGKGKKGKEVHDEVEEVRTERIVAETVTYRWIINNFSKLNCKKLYSETFFVDKHPWRILMYPKGEGYKTKRLSMYMCVGESDTLPAGYYTKPTSVSFTILHYDRWLPWRRSFHKLHDPRNSYLRNDTLHVKAVVSVIHHGTYYDHIIE
ncbi:hypothetical protein PIB30_015342, partial [Stylosanthes scabra]|nr:hypothetical protein [Stylosanthes scabra]